MKTFSWSREGYDCWEQENNEKGQNRILLETEIEGGNFSQAGEASGELKTAMKKLGIDHSHVKRSAVSAYEAEINVVIHADRGEMKSTINSKYVQMVVTDEGEGIGDIEKAMKPGFSTAPEKIREMGFGAGLGLPNIKRNADRLKIKTEEGNGTTLIITICLD